MLEVIICVFDRCIYKIKQLFAEESEVLYSDQAGRQFYKMARTSWPIIFIILILPLRACICLIDRC